MADNEITVRIMADDSDLKAGVQSAARAVQDMGGAVENSTESIEKLNRGMVHLSSHLISHAIPGVGRMGMVMARMGEAAIGVGAVMAAVIPVAAIVAAVEIMDKLEEATYENQKAATEWALEESKLGDKIMEEKEKLVGLTHGPLAEAILKTKDFANMTNDLASSIKIADTEIDRYSTKWAAYVEWVQRATSAMKEWAKAGGGLGGITSGVMAFDTGAMSDTALKTKLALIVETNTKNKDYVNGMRELQAVMVQLNTAGGPHSQQQMQGVQDAMEDLQRRIALAADKQKVNLAEVGKIQKSNDEEAITRIIEMAKAQGDNFGEVMKMEQAAANNESLSLKFRQKMQDEVDKAQLANIKLLSKGKLKEEEELAAETLKTRTRVAKEDEEVRKEIDKSAAENHKKLWEDTFKALDVQEREIQKQTALELAQVKTKSKGGLEDSSESDAVYDRQIEKLRQMAQTKSMLLAQMESEKGGTGLDDEAVQRVRESQQAIFDIMAQYAQKKMELDNQVAQHNAATINSMTASFNSGISQWMKGGITFSRSMTQAWESMAGSMIQSIMKSLEADVAALVMRKALAKEDILVKAGQAGAKAMAQYPFPLDVLMASVEFAKTAAFASFDRGGIMEMDGAAMIHKREMVLPPHISDWVQKAAGATDNSQSFTGGDLHYSPVIHAMDANGVEDVLKQHSDVIFKMVQQGMRNRNLL